MSDKTKILLALIVGLGAGLIMSVHPRTWTLGMFLVAGMAWLGLGIFVGWKTGAPLWLIEIVPSLKRKFFQS